MKGDLPTNKLFKNQLFDNYTKKLQKNNFSYDILILYLC